jgi:outer membrane protein assembly factor BamB
MRTVKTLLLVMFVCVLVRQPAISGAERGSSIPERIGVMRGICVVLGEGAAERAIKLARESELLIYVQLTQAEDVQTARQAVDAAGLYGTCIFVAKGPANQLNLADNIADAVVVAGGAGGIPETEVLRVLRPQGKALFGGKVLVKPVPAGVDDWSHPYHGPDNNPQSNDQVIKAPYLTQFLAEPRYAPLPQVAVASAGRVFKAFGHIAFKTREEPFLNKLVAFDGYNGTMLWQRNLTEGVMIHRNTMIATPAKLYVGDDKSCKIIDTATGRLLDEIIPPSDVAGGTFWKWMGMENGVLFCLIGEQEQKDPTMRWGREAHGWPWNPISRGFNQADKIKDSAKAYVAHPWGFGRNVLAIDPETKKILWSHHEDEPVDGRAICMKDGRIYIFRFGAYLASLDAKTGDCLWRKTPANDPALFEAIGPYSNRQGPAWNWRTTCYLKCSDDALYFAGPQVGKLVAVSAETGEVLWSDPYNNYQLILQKDKLYAISGQNDQGNPSKIFDPLSGRVLAKLQTGRRACTRPTGDLDAIFYRARGGSTRLDLATGRPELISPMRPPCQDGVTIANGLLYWWPYVCDCQLTLYGITCLAPADDFNFQPRVSEAARLEKGEGDPANVATLPESPTDWPTFRADNICSATTKASIPAEAQLLWQYDPKMTVPVSGPAPTAPVAAGGLIFIGGPDGIVRALDVASGVLQWKAYTGGPVRMPPTIWQGRALVGSGDGWVYAFEAKTGRLLWRFRAAPAERTIPVYGALQSTWPAASGVLVEDGVAYVAAGIVNYDGTYVYALDAATGHLKWMNDTSGHLDTEARSGVSVQGHLLLYDGKLYLAGGNAVSPAIYDIQDGRCLNDPNLIQRLTQNNVLLTQSPRGWELSLLAGHVVACGRPFYAHPSYEVYDPTVFSRVFLSSNSGRDVVWRTNQKDKQILCFESIDRRALSRSMANPRNQFLVDWARLGVRTKPLWSRDCKASLAIAVCRNAVVIAEASQIVALSMGDGSVLWSHPLPAAPVEWGLAIEKRGRAVVALKNGRVLCFGPRSAGLKTQNSRQQSYGLLTEGGL